jgi:hypothetical protein
MKIQLKRAVENVLLEDIYERNHRCDMFTNEDGSFELWVDTNKFNPSHDIITIEVESSSTKEVEIMQI